MIKDVIAKLKAWLDRIAKGKKRPSRRRQGRKNGSNRQPSSRNQGRPPSRRSRQRGPRKSSKQGTGRAAAPRKTETPKKKPAPRKSPSSKTQSRSKNSTPRKRPPRRSPSASQKKDSGVIRPSAVASESMRKSRRRGSRGGGGRKGGDSPEIGEITHYFSKIKVAVVKVTALGLKVGDNINIKGKSTDTIQAVESMQIESVDVKTAKKGQLVGLKLKKPARVGDKVFKVSG